MRVLAIVLLAACAVCVLQEAFYVSMLVRAVLHSRMTADDALYAAISRFTVDGPILALSAILYVLADRLPKRS